MSEWSRRHKKILVVEDNQGDVLLLKSGLKHQLADVTLTIAEDGEQALKVLQGPEGLWPDLVLLDMNLPKKDGREVLRTLRADPRLRRLVVIVFTGSASEQDISAAYDLGANAYIIKPFDPERYKHVLTMLTDLWLSEVVTPAPAK